MVFGQDQKATIVGDQVRPIVWMAKIPTDPGVARGTLPGRGREAQQRQPLAVPGGDIPQSVPDLRQRAQVVMGLHQRLEALLLGRGDGLEDDLAKVNARGRRPQGTDALYTRTTGHGPELWATTGCNSESSLERFSPARQSWWLSIAGPSQGLIDNDHQIRRDFRDRHLRPSGGADGQRGRGVFHGKACGLSRGEVKMRTRSE